MSFWERVVLYAVTGYVAGCTFGAIFITWWFS